MSPLESGFDWAFLIGILTASLAGSTHCIGMCGGLVLTATQPNSNFNSGLLLNQFFYHGARLLSYLILGLMAGVLGEALLSHSVSLYLSIFATFSVALIFIFTGVQIFKGGKLSSPFGQYFSRFILKVFPRVNRLKGALRPLVTGLATGILPCAWLYSFVLMSLSTKSPEKGALVLAFFWLGTVPALSFGTLFIQKILSSLNLRVYRFVGVLLVLIGLWTLYGRAAHISYSQESSLKSSDLGSSCHGD